MFMTKRKISKQNSNLLVYYLYLENITSLSHVTFLCSNKTDLNRSTLNSQLQEKY